MGPIWGVAPYIVSHDVRQVIRMVVLLFLFILLNTGLSAIGEQVKTWSAPWGNVRIILTQHSRLKSHSSGLVSIMISFDGTDIGRISSRRHGIFIRHVDHGGVASMDELTPKVGHILGYVMHECLLIHFNLEENVVGLAKISRLLERRWMWRTRPVLVECLLPAIRMVGTPHQVNLGAGGAVILELLERWGVDLVIRKGIQVASVSIRRLAPG